MWHYELMQTDSEESDAKREDRTKAWAIKPLILQVLSEAPNNEMRAGAALTAVGEKYRAKLSTIDLELQNDGQLKWVGRTRAASEGLVESGHVVRPVRGLWKLTSTGMAQAAANAAADPTLLNGHNSDVAMGESLADHEALTDDGLDQDAVSDYGPDQASGDEAGTPPERRQTVVERIIRSTAISQDVKRTYSNQCQVCGTKLMTASGPYSEGAHIKPLANQPVGGPDIPGNILCLCPNCHVLFDGLAMWIGPDGMVYLHGEPTRVLTVNTGHRIDPAYLEFHRKRCEQAAQ